MDNITCDEFNGIPVPEYLINNVDLRKNMTFIYDVGIFLIFF